MTSHKQDLVALGGSYRKQFISTKQRAINNFLGEQNTVSSSSSLTSLSFPSPSLSSSSSGSFIPLSPSVTLSNDDQTYTGYPNPNPGTSSIPIEQRNTPHISKLSFSLPTAVVLPPPQGDGYQGMTNPRIVTDPKGIVPSTGIPAPVISIPETYPSLSNTNPSSGLISPTTLYEDEQRTSVRIVPPPVGGVGPSTTVILEDNSLPTETPIITENTIPESKESSSSPSLREQALEEQVRLLQSDYYAIFVKLLESENRILAANSNNNNNTQIKKEDNEKDGINNNTVTESIPSEPIIINPSDSSSLSSTSSRSVSTKRSKNIRSASSSISPRSNPSQDSNILETTTSPSVRFAPVYYYPPSTNETTVPQSTTDNVVVPPIASTSVVSPSSITTVSSSNIDENNGYMPLTHSAKRLQQTIMELGDRITYQTTIPVPTFVSPPSTVEPMNQPIQETVPSQSSTLPSSLPSAASEPIPINTIPVPSTEPVNVVTRNEPELSSSTTITSIVPGNKHASIFSFISSSLASAKIPKSDDSNTVITLSPSSSSSTTVPTDTSSSTLSLSALETQNQELMETIKILSNRLTEALQLSEVVQAERDAIHDTLQNLKKIDRRLSIVLGIRAGAYLSAYRNEKVRTEEATVQCKKALTASEAALRAQHSALQQLLEKVSENEQQKKYIDELETSSLSMRNTIEKQTTTHEMVLAERTALKDSVQMHKKLHQQTRIAFSVRLAASILERDHTQRLANEYKENETKANTQAMAALKSQKLAQQQARQAEEKKNDIESLYNENLAKIAYLTSQNELLQKKQQQYNDEKTILHQTITRMRQVLSHQSLASGIRLSAVRHQLANEKLVTAKLQEQYTNAVNTVQETKEAAKFARTELAKAITTRDTVMEQYHTLEQQLTMVTQQYRNSTNQITILTTEKDALHNSMKLMRTVNRQQYLALGVRTAALLKEKDELVNALTNTRKALQDEKNEAQRLLTNQQNLTNTNQELVQENNRLQKDLVTERNQSTTLTAVITSLSKQVENNNNSSAIANAERDALMNTLHHMKKIEHVKEEWSMAAHGVLAKLHKLEEEKTKNNGGKKESIEVSSPSKGSTIENSQSKHTEAPSHGLSSWFGGGSNSTNATVGSNNHEVSELQKKLKLTEQKLKETETKLHQTETELQHTRTAMKNETTARQQAEAERDVLHTTISVMKAEQTAKSNWTHAVTAVVAAVNNDNVNESTEKKDKKEKKKKKDKNNETESVTGNEEILSSSFSSSSAVVATTATEGGNTAVDPAPSVALADENNKLKTKLKEKRNELKAVETRIQELEAELARYKSKETPSTTPVADTGESERLKYNYEQLQLTLNDTSQHLSRKLQEKDTELQVSIKRIHQLQLLLDTYAESGSAIISGTDLQNIHNNDTGGGVGSLSTSSSFDPTSERSSQNTSTAATPTRKQSLAPSSSTGFTGAKQSLPKYSSANRYLPSSSASSTVSANFFKRAAAEPVFVEHAKVNTKKYETTSDLYGELQTLDFANIQSQIILGIDCTKSNLWNGAVCFQGRNLHDVSDPTVINPYQRVISIIGETMSHLDVDNLIPVYGFGDKSSADTSVFSFVEPNQVCNGFDNVLECYKARIPHVQLAGPTSFAPIIRTAITHMQEAHDSFSILIILCDGEVTAVQDTELAIVEASKYPLSIICIGIGDGPWTQMRCFDDGLPKRRFDNFHFVELNAIEKLSVEQKQTFRETFVCSTLAELPSQIAELQRLRMI